MLITLTHIIIAIAILFLFLAGCFDLKTGEIPNRISVGLAVVTSVIALAHSIHTWNFSFITNSLLIGIIYFIVGYIPFHLGGWGGGDVKVLAGVGCVLGYLDAMNYFSIDNFNINTELFYHVPYYLSYLVNIGFATIPYIVVYGLILGILRPVIFNKFLLYFRNKFAIVLLFASVIPAIISSILEMNSLVSFYLILPVFVTGSFYLKAVDEFALQKMINVRELEEEDVVAEDLVVDGKKIADKRDIEGINKEQINQIIEMASKGKIPDMIMIKWGIRFAPIFLIGFLLTVFVGDLMGLGIMYMGNMR